jgi:tRNA (adenine22-N1)-methyltransferase
LNRTGGETANGGRPGPRLAAIVDRVPPGSRVADVGSDHGRLAESLLRSGRAVACIATEKRAHRLDVLRARLATGRPLAGLELRVGDGLAPLVPADRIDVIVLAGMGGDTIRRILDRAIVDRLSPSRLIVQPQTRHADVRAFLRRAGFRLIDECAVREDDRHYVVIVARPGPETAYVAPGDDLDEDDLLAAGPLLVARRDPVALEAWADEVDRLAAIVAELPPGSGDRARESLARARRIVRALSRPAG